MQIEHLAIWVSDLEAMRTFYETWFNAQAGPKYYNPSKQFSSYFLSFDHGPRLELMHRPDIRDVSKREAEHKGIAHFAVSLGSKEKVDDLTNSIRSAGWTVAGEPRTTGDGYYESVILDPEGNRIELTI